MKMEPIVSSETSAIRTQTPGNYPKRNNLNLDDIIMRLVCSVFMVNVVRGVENILCEPLIALDRWYCAHIYAVSRYNCLFGLTVG